jgi:tetratricopeptide (TPR) repeat protein
MISERKVSKKRYAYSAKFLCPLILLLLVNGCSSHDKKFSYFDMLDESKRTQGNKLAAEKFWSSVRPVSTLSDSHYRLGRHYQEKGQYEKAIGEFSKALRNDRTYCKAYNGIAMSYDALKQCEPAHASYDQAMKCDPDKPYVYNNYACSSLLCGDYVKGVELFRKAEQLAGDNQRIKNNLRIAQAIAAHKDTVGVTAGRLPDTVVEPVPAVAMSESEKAAADHPEYRLPEETLHSLLSQTQEHETMTENTPAANIQTLPPLPDTAEAAREITEVPSSASTTIVIEPIKLIADKYKKTPPTASEISISKAATPHLASLAIEVSNGNGVTGMAGRSAAFLRGHGFKVKSITNAKHFRFQESKIFYKEGYLHVAKELAAVIPGLQSLERVDTVEKASVGVKVLLGRDLVDMRFPGRLKGVAGYSEEKIEPLMASNSSDTDTAVHN